MTKQISNLLIMIGVDYNELYYGRYVVQISSLLLLMGIDHIIDYQHSVRLTFWHLGPSHAACTVCMQWRLGICQLEFIASPQHCLIVSQILLHPEFHCHSWLLLPSPTQSPQACPRPHPRPHCGHFKMLPTILCWFYDENWFYCDFIYNKNYFIVNLT